MSGATLHDIGEELSAEVEEERRVLAHTFDLSFTEPPETASEAEAERECNRLLAALGSVRDNKAANARLRDEEVQRVQHWLSRVNGPLERQESYLLGMLRHFSGFVRYFGKAKSRDLPHGRVGWRTKPERIEVETEELALEWARRNHVRVNESVSVYVSELSKAWKDRRKEDPSFVPPGCKVVEAEETFFADPQEVA